MQVGETDRLAQSFFIRIVRIGSGAETAAPDINRIRARVYCGPQALKGTGRRKKLYLMSHMVFPPFFSESHKNKAPAINMRLTLFSSVLFCISIISAVPPACA